MIRPAATWERQLRPAHTVDLLQAVAAGQHVVVHQHQLPAVRAFELADAHQRTLALERLGFDVFAQPYRDYDGGEPTAEQKAFARWVNVKSVHRSSGGRTPGSGTQQPGGTAGRWNNRGTCFPPLAKWIRFVRLSCDTSGMVPVIEQAAAYLKEAGIAPSRTCFPPLAAAPGNPCSRCPR